MGYATFSTQALIKLLSRIEQDSILNPGKPDKPGKPRNAQQQEDEIREELKRRADAHKRPDTGTMELQGLEGYKITKGNEINEAK